MKLAGPEAPIPDKDDAPTPGEGNKHIDIEVLIPRGYHLPTVAHRKWNVDE